MATSVIDRKRVSGKRTNGPTARQRKRAAAGQYLAIILATTGGSRQVNGDGAIGGSDMAGRMLRALGLIDAKSLVGRETACGALGKVNKGKAKAWARTYIAGLVDNKANQRRLRNFEAWIDQNGPEKVREALEWLHANGFNTVKLAYTIGETIRSNPNLDELANDVFGIHLTATRKRKSGQIL
jgi:hypothetical protein